jgi:phage-related minor tail protein
MTHPSATIVLTADDQTSATLQGFMARVKAAKAQTDQLSQGLSQAAPPMDKLGMSARQTAAAMRMVPPQITDIIVSLQGGQKPLTVLMQQGGQLKDMFGGVGAAAKALGTYIAGLATPINLAMGGAAALGVAFYLGSKEAGEFQKALILSGRAAGVTARQMQDMARSMGRVQGTQAAASGALIEMATTGRIAGEQLQAYASAALAMQRAVGTSVAETAKAFAQLGQAPLQATLKLNEGTHFLTLSLYQQIKALEDQGRQTDAAKVAQDAYAQATEQRAAEVVKNLGLVEHAWLRIKDAAKAAGDKMLSVGRQATLQDQIEALQAKIAERQEFNRQLGLTRDPGGRHLRAQLATLQGLANAQEASAKAVSEAIAEGNDRLQARIDFDREQARFLSNELRMRQDIAKVQAQFNAAAGAISAAERDGLVENIRRKYQPRAATDSGAAHELTRIRALIKEEETLTQRLKERGIEGAKLTDAEKLVSRIQQDLQASLSGVARAHKEVVLAEAQRYAQAQAARLAQEQQARAVANAQKAYDALVADTQRAAQAIAQQASELEAANQVWGQGKSAIEAYRLEQLKLKLQEAQASDAYRPDYVAALTAQVDQQQRLLAASRVKDYKTLAQSQAEFTRQLHEQAQLATDELGLLGLGAREREKVVALRKVELDLARQKAAIDRSGASAEHKAQLLEQARAAAAIARSNALARTELNTLTDAIHSVDRTAQSVWTNVFQGGQSAFEKIGATLKASVLDMLYQLTIRKWVVNITAQVLGGGAVGGALGGNGVGTGGGLLNLASGAARLAGLPGLAGTLGSAMPYVGGALAAYALLSKITGGESRSGGQYGVAFDGRVLNQRRGETYTDVGQQYKRNLSTGVKVTNGQAYLIEADGLGDREAATRQAVASTAASINALLKGLGSQAYLSDFHAGLETSGHGRGGVFAGGSLNTGATFGESGKGSNYSGTLYETSSTRSPDMATAIANFTLDLKQSTIQALQAAQDIPQSIAAKLKDIDAEKLSDDEATQLITQINSQIASVEALRTLAGALPLKSLKDLSFDAADGLITLAGGIDALNQKISSYYENFYTQDERNAQTLGNVSAALQSVGLSTPKTREAFRALVEAQDLSTEAGRKTYATLMNVADAFASVVPSAQDLARATQAQAQANRQAAQAASDQAYSALERAVAAERARLQASHQVAQESAKTLADIFSNLQAHVTQLYNTTSATQQGSARAGLQFIDQALSTAQRSGYLPDATALANAITAARSGLDLGLDSGQFSSAFEQQRAQLTLAGKLASLQDLTGAQKTVAQQQLTAAQDQLASLDTLLAQAKDQLDALRGIDTRVQSVAQALAGLAAALQHEGAHTSGAGAPLSDLGGVQGYRSDPWLRAAPAAGVPRLDVGTNYVPQDMLALIHEGEAVVPKAYNPAAQAGQAGLHSTELLTRLIAEVQALRQQTERLETQARRTANATNGNPEGGAIPVALMEDHSA